MSPGREITLLAPAFLLLATLTRAQHLPTYGNVGCILHADICGEDEKCFDDLVLGRCVSASSNEEHHRLGPLSGPPLGLLGAEIRRLFGMGLTWKDVYTQCVLQTLLHHFQYRLPYSIEECDYLLEAQQQVQDLRQPGYPPEHYWDNTDFSFYLRPDQNDVDTDDYLPDPTMKKPEWMYYTADNGDDNQTPDEDTDSLVWKQQRFRDLDQLRDMETFLQEPQEEASFYQPDSDTGHLPEIMDTNDMMMDGVAPNYSDWEGSSAAVADNPYPLDQDLEQLMMASANDDELLANLWEYLGSYPELEQTKDMAPLEDIIEEQYSPVPVMGSEDGFQQGLLPPYQLNRNNFPAHTQTQFQQLRDFATQFQPDNIYDMTDDDKAFVRRQRDVNLVTMNGRPGVASNDWLPVSNDDIDNVSTYDFDYNDSSAVEEGDNDDTIYYSMERGADGPETSPFVTVFDRRERLDVKKPGPFFSNSQNNFFLDKLTSSSEHQTMDYDQNDLDRGQTEYEMPLSTQPSKKKKGIINEPLGEIHEMEPIPTTYLVFLLENRLRNLGQANAMQKIVSDITQVPLKSFGVPKLEVSKIKFLVHPNPQQLNATAMASRLTDQIEKVNEKSEKIGLRVDQILAVNEDGAVSTYTGDANLFLSLYLLAAGLGVILLMTILLFLVKRKRNSAKKIETKLEKEEPVNEYKQLVRDWSRSSRTSSSGGHPGPGVAPAPPTPAAATTVNHPAKCVSTPQNGDDHRAATITNSTPWSEDPGVSTMDISTGHMVLNYMEDHLNNKQRLEQEWVGLCAYEAEPAATSIAFQVENKKKNRYPDKLPYDHNRVLLNALVNGTNSDYINASTVTDHDPRNPAYIVTQGPMAHTVADFWQMVWEQGSVVIVMLSRLAENGYQLAHRYWPEDGSEQYHIYEVHLVSEHVWCDDYLVRSLYLKNTQTNETRTVTQFHFLSWPDGSVPGSAKSLLEFRRKVNKSYRGRSCPIIVHCSDGVGRSGTYILIDMVLNRIMQGSKEIDIAATLEHIRDQRSGMVQTRSQFEFCLTSVAEETHAILKSLAQQ